jgi:hypothetical protein
MNEEFYAVIKLVSGEEIFSKVCAFEENQDILLVLDHPVFVETTYSPKLRVPIARINPWINLTEETTFIINRDKVMTMTEVKDTTLVKMHKRYIKEHNKSSNQSKISPNMGYITSIPEARVSLEKLYRSNSASRTQE